MAKKSAKAEAAPSASVKAPVDGKARLAGALSAINALGGNYARAQVNMGRTDAHPAVSTGNMVIDYTIGGRYCQGFPRGCISEVYGKESTGKTTLAVQTCARAIEMGGTAGYLDYEYALNPGYSRKLGLDVTGGSFLALQPVTFEEGARMARELVKAQVDVLVFDSLAAMIPKKILEMEDIDKEQMIGIHARRTSQLMTLLISWMKQYGGNPAIIFINQIRMGMVKAGGKTITFDTTPGGNALRFYASLRLLLKAEKTEFASLTDAVTGVKKLVPYNTTIKVVNKKNKVAPRQNFFDFVALRFGAGFDIVRTLLNLAQKHEIIKSGGQGVYTYTDRLGAEVFKLRGIEAVRNRLASTESEFTAIKSLLIERMEAAEAQDEKDRVQNSSFVEKSGGTEDGDDEDDDDGPAFDPKTGEVKDIDDLDKAFQDPEDKAADDDDESGDDESEV